MGQIFLPGKAIFRRRAVARQGKSTQPRRKKMPRDGVLAFFKQGLGLFENWRNAEAGRVFTQGVCAVRKAAKPSTVIQSPGQAIGPRRAAARQGSSTRSRRKKTFWDGALPIFKQGRSGLRPLGSLPAGAAEPGGKRPPFWLRPAGMGRLWCRSTEKSAEFV